jgi:hypothetical protein
MTQEMRRHLIARARLRPEPHTEDDVPGRLPMRRFSEGLERRVLDRLRPHVGRFSDGLQRTPERPTDPDRIGRFSRGQDHAGAARSTGGRVGRFDDVDRYAH